MEYKKPPLTYDQQLDLLISRGLKVDDENSALTCLKNISYYRLSAYFLPFKQSENFKSNTKFDDIVDLYTFDRKLRLLILEAIEPIEIAIRTQIIYHLSHTYGAFGYLNPKNFSTRFKHAKFLQHLEEAIEDSTETFIWHYKNHYSESKHMPLWMALEVISFGGTSRLFMGLHGSDQQIIAKKYDVTDIVLSSWLHILVYIRNLCAHHARLWNRRLTFKPKLPNKSIIWKDVSNDNVFCILAIIKYLLHNINPDSTWGSKVTTLLNEYPVVSRLIMRFSTDWQKFNSYY